MRTMNTFKSVYIYIFKNVFYMQECDSTDYAGI